MRKYLVKTASGDMHIEANALIIDQGVLAFLKTHDEEGKQGSICRAFAKDQWTDVEVLLDGKETRQ